jgi:hypothetical protein
MATPNGNSFPSPTTTTQPNGNATNGTWKPRYPNPPTVKPYDPREALDDIPGVSYALEQFLASHMVESEEYCHRMDETKFVQVFWPLWRCGIWLTLVNFHQGAAILCHWIWAYPMRKRTDVLC